MLRALSLGLALVVAWSVQAISWSRAPASADRHTLIAGFADQVRPGDEVAYLPGWEQGWALALGQRLAGHSQRLGRDDLLRPYARLWLLSSNDAAVYSPPQGVRQTQIFEHASMRAVLLQRDQRVEPIAWPVLGGCQLSAKRRSCSSSGGRVSYGEIGLDGRFAMGFKVKPGKKPMVLTFSLPAGASLVGGLGWTAHGARNGQGSARWRAKGATTQEGVLKKNPGLLPLVVRSGERGKVSLEVEGLDAKGLELGLSVGWVQ